MCLSMFSSHPSFCDDDKRSPRALKLHSDPLPDFALGILYFQRSLDEGSRRANEVTSSKDLQSFLASDLLEKLVPQQQK